MVGALLILPTRVDPLLGPLLYPGGDVPLVADFLSENGQIVVDGDIGGGCPVGRPSWSWANSQRCSSSSGSLSSLKLVVGEPGSFCPPSSGRYAVCRSSITWYPARADVREEGLVADPDVLVDVTAVVHDDVERPLLLAEFAPELRVALVALVALDGPDPRWTCAFCSPCRGSRGATSPASALLHFAQENRRARSVVDPGNKAGNRLRGRGVWHVLHATAPLPPTVPATMRAALMRGQKGNVVRRNSRVEGLVDHYLSATRPFAGC